METNGYSSRSKKRCVALRSEHPTMFPCKSNRRANIERTATTLHYVEKKLKVMGTGLGYTTLVKHDIQTESRPIKQRYYPVSPPKQKRIDEELNPMLELKIFKPSKSAWSSPVVLVPKKDGGYRFCVDFRRLNSATKNDAYPIPYTSSILDRLKNARYLSSMDIKSTFWQVPIGKASWEYTAFTIPRRGLFQFIRMPFGLSNAPATWQRLIDQVLGADLEPNCFVYLDDIIIISEDFKTYLDVLNKVFDRLIAAGLTVSMDKCKFCRSELKYLGYVVDRMGVRTDPEKVQAIPQVSAPKNVNEVRRFVGMASWYRRFVPNFASVMEPITRLTRKSVRFVWKDESERALHKVKHCLVSAPILTCPNFEKDFILQTDASSYGIGTVLYQKEEDGERVICF